MDRATPFERQAEPVVPASRASQGMHVVGEQETIGAEASDVWAALQATSMRKGGDKVDLVLELVVNMMHDMRELMAMQRQAKVITPPVVRPRQVLLSKSTRFIPQ
ncbi:hypothetical protein ACLOJK_006886, partial [Asimina triloba]